jgi:Protein of unknown function (DUF3592)
MYAVVGAGHLRECLQSESWPTASGVVRASGIRTDPGWATVYAAQVRYDFVVAGQVFNGQRLAVVESRTDEASARAVVSRYARGTAVAVRFSPHDPARSVLEPGVTRGALHAAWIPLAMVAVSALLLVGVWRPGGRAVPPSVGTLAHPTLQDRQALLTRFEPLAVDYRARQRKFWIGMACFATCVVLGMLSKTSVPAFGLFGCAAIVSFVYLVRVAPRLPACPACQGGLDAHNGTYCPECGARALGAAGWFGARRCSACSKTMSWSRRGGRRYRIHACTHCGLVMDMRGL